VTTFIDPEELPFSADEVFHAGCLFLPTEAARAMAEHLEACGPDLIEQRRLRRAGWRAAGVPNADTLPLHGWVYPDELLPALASLSESAFARSLRLMEAHWQGCAPRD
jgi:hypothetical protein